MSETDAGLYVEGQLDLEDSEQAREVWRLVKRNAIGLSFGYLVTKSRKRSDGVTELLELDLFEVSLTGAPVNQDARILSTKGAGPDLGLGDIFRDDQGGSNGTADMIKIVGPDGRPQLVSASAPFWWEEQEAKQLREFERKMMPIQVARLEL
jgi:Caudovirus prohead serine protease